MPRPKPAPPGRQSAAATGIITDAPSVLSLNIAETVTEHPAFAGAKTNVAVIDGALTLDSALTKWRLKHIATGAMRDGAPVTKSRLVPSPEAHKIRDFLLARAIGVSRRQALADAGLDGLLDSTLIGMEWNALTYAGHTVWNVHAERIAGGGGYKGGTLGAGDGRHRPAGSHCRLRTASQPPTARAAVTVVAERLPVPLVPKQMLITTMRDDVVHHRGGDYLSSLKMISTERMRNHD